MCMFSGVLWKSLTRCQIALQPQGSLAPRRIFKKSILPHCCTRLWAHHVLQRAAQVFGHDFCRYRLQQQRDVISLFSGIECAHMAWVMIEQAALDILGVRCGLRFVSMVACLNFCRTISFEGCSVCLPHIRGRKGQIMPAAPLVPLSRRLPVSRYLGLDQQPRQ